MKKSWTQKLPAGVWMIQSFDAWIDGGRLIYAEPAIIMTGMPPLHMYSRDKASARDTATTKLIFETDDKVLERVMEALQDLFFAPPSATDRIPYAKANLRAMFKGMLEAQFGPDGMDDAFVRAVRTVIADELSKQIKEINRMAKTSRTLPKGKSRR